MSLARLSRVDSAERAGAYVAAVWPAASTAFRVAPSSAPLPALERVGHCVRGGPGIERLQRIDDVVVIDDIPVAVARSAGFDSIAHASDADDASTDRFSASVMSVSRTTSSGWRKALEG